ncbi:MAG: fibronectin type III domain-containing protein, partial [Chloroflexota bacterium]
MVLSTGAGYPNSYAGNLLLSTSPAGPAPHATPAGLSPNTTYQLFVSALNNNGVDTLFVGLGATVTLAAEPSGPSVFWGTGVSSFSVTWNSNGNPLAVTTYTVQASSSSSFGGAGDTVISESTLPAGGPSKTFTSLLPNTLYYVRAFAQNHAGLATGFGALGSTATLAQIPSSDPAPFAVVGISSIQARWQSGGNPLATEYELQAS